MCDADGSLRPPDGDAFVQFGPKRLARLDGELTADGYALRDGRAVEEARVRLGAAGGGCCGLGRVARPGTSVSLISRTANFFHIFRSPWVGTRGTDPGNTIARAVVGTDPQGRAAISRPRGLHAEIKALHSAATQRPLFALHIATQP